MLATLPWPRLRAQALPIMGATTLTLLAGLLATGWAKAETAGDRVTLAMSTGHMLLGIAKREPVGVGAGCLTARRRPVFPAAAASSLVAPLAPPRPAIASPTRPARASQRSTTREGASS